MSHLSFRTSRADRWTQPRGSDDASLRYRAYGKVQPMEEPSLLERWFGNR